MTLTQYAGYSLLAGTKKRTGLTILLLADTAGKLFVGYRDANGCRDEKGVVHPAVFYPPVAAKTPDGVSFAGIGLGQLLSGQGAILDYYYVDGNQTLQHLLSNNDGLLWKKTQ